MILGIDPGAYGALAWVKQIGDGGGDGGCRHFAETVLDMPIIKTGKTGQGKRLDPAKLSFILETFKSQTDFVVVEQQGPRPWQHAKSTFSLGRNYGDLMTCLEVLEMPYVEVTPAAWKAAMGLTSNKSLSITRAKLAFPDNVEYFKRSVDHGRAEAALLALFAYKFGVKR